MALGAVWSRVKNVCQQNGLLILSVLAVVIGCLLGFFLRSKQLSEQVSFGFPPPVVTPTNNSFPAMTQLSCHLTH